MAAAFLFSTVFNLITNYFTTQPSDTQTHPASNGQTHSTTLGERRDIEVGYKRYYDEDELDVGLGLVKDEKQLDPSAMTKVKILYCIG